MIQRLKPSDSLYYSISLHSAFPGCLRLPKAQIRPSDKALWGVDVTPLLLGCRSRRLTLIAEEEEEEGAERMRTPLEKGRKSKDKRMGGDAREAEGIPPSFPQQPHSLQSLTPFSHSLLSLLAQSNISKKRHLEHKVAPRRSWPAEGRLPRREGRKEASGSRSEDQSSGGGGGGGR